MTKLGVKWSAIAAGVLPLVDLIEVDGWMLSAPLPPGPKLLHNLDLDFSLTAPGAIDQGWAERARRALDATGAPWFSLHLGFSAERVRFEGHMLPVSAVLDRETCFDRLVKALLAARRALPVPLLIENLDYCPEGAYEYVCEPDFIVAVLEETGCDLLLDLAHLQVSADWLGIDAEAYLDRLPLDRVIEVHLSSPRVVNGRLDDGHYHLIDRDERLLDALLARCAPRAVVLEYRRDAGLLRDQLSRLRARLDRSETATR